MAAEAINALWREAGREVALAGAAALAIVLLAGHFDLLIAAQMALALALYASMAVLILRGLRAHLPHASFGLANRITLMRATAVALLSGLVAGPIDGALSWIAAVVAIASLIADALDGWAARSSGLASRFGARFDMEVDAFLILALSAILVRLDKVGAWILFAGAIRYVFVAAALILPALRAPLPPSRRRRVICAVQVATLAAALLPPVPAAAAAAIAGTGLAAIAFSFAVDVVWLLRHAQVPRSDSCLST